MFKENKHSHTWWFWVQNWIKAVQLAIIKFWTSRWQRAVFLWSQQMRKNLHGAFLRQKHSSVFRQKKISKISLYLWVGRKTWEGIAIKLQEKGYRQKYKMVRLLNNVSGQRKKSLPLFEELNMVLGHKQRIIIFLCQHRHLVQVVLQVGMTMNKYSGCTGNRISGE